MVSNIHRELAELVARQQLVFFVGAGLSIGAGLPGWADVVRPLASSIGVPWPDEEQYLTSDYLLGALQHYENARGRNALVFYLRDVLDTTQKKPSNVHRVLASQSIGPIFTTNYDDLIERSIREAGKRPNVIVEESDLAFWDDSSIQVVKLCGDLSQPETLIVTNRDFHTYLEKRPRIAERLRSHLESRAPLFIGYSLRDPFMNQLWDSIGLTFGPVRQRGYAILFDPNPLEVQDLQLRNIITISLSGNRSKQLSDWLKIFMGELAVIQDKELVASRRDNPLDENSIESKLDELLDGQRSISQQLSAMTQNLSEEDRMILRRILVVLEQGKIEQARAFEMLNSIRRWAMQVQKEGLPADASLQAAINELGKKREGNVNVYQYLEASLPLIPGILTYKVEFGSEHKARLQEIWDEVIRSFGSIQNSV